MEGILKVDALHYFLKKKLAKSLQMDAESINFALRNQEKMKG